MVKNGIEKVTSPYSVEETAERFEKILDENGVKLFTKIDHSKNIRKVDLELRETVLFIFGSPQVGGLLMQENQEVALDLPMKLLVWKNEEGKTILSRNQISWIKERHDLRADGAAGKLENKVKSMVEETIA